MPRFSPEASDDSGPRELAPIGQYALRCVKVEEKESRGGDAYWLLRWEIVGGPFSSSWVKDIVMFAGKAAGWHLRKLKTIYGDQYVEGMEFTEADMEFREAWGWVGHDEYQGTTRLEVDGKGGPDGCGYAHRTAATWPDDPVVEPGTRNESGVADTGEPHNFDDIPF